ncbi:uncharacterized protein [Anabrus simplex]
MVLCMSSPKFEELLLTQKPDVPIEITDIEPRIFHLMLDYMYLDTIDLKSAEDACSVFTAAVKYQIPHLCEITAKYVAQDMNLENVWPVLKLVAETQEPVLKEECAKFIRKNPSAVLRHENFLKVDRVVVLMLVDLDCMDVPEGQLLNAVDKWAEQKCLDLNYPADRENKRAAIGPEVIMKLRFLALSQEEFVKTVAYTHENSSNCLLSLDESYSILMNLVSFGSYPMPTGFSGDKRPRKLSRLRCMRKVMMPPTLPPVFPGGFTTPPPGMFGTPFSAMDRVVALSSPSLSASLGGKNFTLDVKVDNPIVLYGIQVPALWFPTQQAPKITSKEYDESFIVSVLDPSGAPISHTILTGKVAYGSSVDINLKESIILQKNVAYKIQVYTTNSYYLCQKLNSMEECPPVTFTFKDTAKVGSGPLYPSNAAGVKPNETEFGFITQLIYSVWG